MQKLCENNDELKSRESNELELLPAPFDGTLAIFSSTLFANGIIAPVP